MDRATIVIFVLSNHTDLYAQGGIPMEDKRMPEYEAPQVTTYTDEEILEELGPAQAIYGKLPGNDGLNP
jgi:hypothetical protein